MISPALPAWARELFTLLPVCSHYLLSGNTRDLYFADAAVGAGHRAGKALRDLPALLAGGLRAEGIEVLLTYDISSGTTTLPDDEEASRRASELLGADVLRLARPGSLPGLADLIERVSSAPAPAALILSSASRLVRDVTDLAEPEFEFFRIIDRLARNSQTNLLAGSDRQLHSPIIWILDSERDVPSWFALRNESLRSIVLPLPHAGERRMLADRLVPTLPRQDDADLAPAARTLAEQMSGMTLVAMNRTVEIARDQGLGVDRVEDAARSYRVGVTDNPWRADHLIERLRHELVSLDPAAPGSGSALAARVLGQDGAVRKALDILVRSATGLTAAQAGPTATRPRGVLFFAGPTGVGKTELAKALTKLLFDDERFYIRFDMSEFSAEHAADRLIGAPPGYVGYDAGGELTNAIRQRPFSLVLFDEIEKAHPRILDKFLQLLDDGRLTDGRGETVFFTESVIVFTSNLGLYSEVSEPDEHGVIVRRRRPTVDRQVMSHSEMSIRIEAAIRDYFTLELGRPELLNRIGDNIVVFDFIDQSTGAQILDLMIENILARVRQEHGIDLEVASEARSALLAACADERTLALGGRGIGSMLETALINPLAIRLFVDRIPPGQRGTVRLHHVGDVWTAHLTFA